MLIIVTELISIPNQSYAKHNNFLELKTCQSFGVLQWHKRIPTTLSTAQISLTLTVNNLPSVKGFSHIINTHNEY